MSSKRKNTPTKLSSSTDDLFVPPPHKERRDSVTSAMDSDCCSDSSCSDDQLRDSDSTDNRPQSKKQRLLQSVRMTNNNNHQYGESGTNTHSSQEPQEINNLINNNLSKSDTSPSDRVNLDLINKLTNSMVSGGERLTMSPPSGQDIRKEQESPLVSGIRSVMASSGSVEEKEMKLNEMILHLQSLKETLSKEKQVSFSVKQFSG